MNKLALTALLTILSTSAMAQSYNTYPQGSSGYNEQWQAEQARRQAEFSQREFQQRQLDMQHRQLQQMEQQTQAMERQNQQYANPYRVKPY